MSKTITLTLPREIVDEFLNHLHDGIEVWRDTEEYLASGSVMAPCVIAECSSVRKARKMMRLYEGTVSLIENKVGKNIVNLCDDSSFSVLCITICFSYCFFCTRAGVVNKPGWKMGSYCFWRGN